MDYQDAVEAYILLRAEGLSDEAAAEIVGDPYYTYTDYMPVKKDEPWQVLLALAMIFVCVFCVFLGG